MKTRDNKGQVVGGLQVFVMSIVTIGVTLAIGLYVLEQVSSSMTADGASANATDEIITALATAPTWIALLVVVVFASAILAYFYMRQ